MLSPSCCRWLCMVTLAVLAVGAGRAADDPTEWPLLQRDPQNAACWRIRGTMTRAPERRATYALDGSPPLADCLLADLDGDGRAEFLFGCADGDLHAVKAPREGPTGVVL